MLHDINWLKQMLGQMHEFCRVYISNGAVVGSYPRNLAKFLAGGWFLSEAGNSVARIRNYIDGVNQLVRRGAPPGLMRWITNSLKERVYTVRTQDGQQWINPAVLHIHPDCGGLGIPDEEGRVYWYAPKIHPVEQGESSDHISNNVPCAMSAGRAEQVRERLAQLNIHISAAQERRITTYCAKQTWAADTAAEGQFSVLMDTKRADYLRQEVDEDELRILKLVEVENQEDVEAELKAWMEAGSQPHLVTRARKNYDLMAAEAGVAGHARDYKTAVAAEKGVPEEVLTQEWAAYGPNTAGGAGDFQILCSRFAEHAASERTLPVSKREALAWSFRCSAYFNMALGILSQGYYS